MASIVISGFEHVPRNNRTYWINVGVLTQDHRGNVLTAIVTTATAAATTTTTAAAAGGAARAWDICQAKHYRFSIGARGGVC